jgi:acetyl/propionyl-CoA carboxylase alpha subunit
MKRALDEYQVRGIETNLAFHRRCFRQAQFIAGEYDTSFIGRNAAELTARVERDAELEAAIIAAVLEAGTASPAAAVSRAHHNGASTVEISGWRRQLR